ncbi:MAG: hypothetical protein OHK0011_09670 [Turneriella sp.]
MATGIGISLALGGLAMVILTFRGGVSLYQKLLGWLTFAALAWFYRPEFTTAYSRLLRGDYRTGAREFANLVQVAMPVIAFTFTWLAFLASSARDAGRILVFFFVLFLISAVAKILFLA